MSGWWSTPERLVVERGAMLADMIADSGTVSAHRELRAIESDLGLSRVGRIRQRILGPGEEPPQEQAASASKVTRKRYRESAEFRRWAMSAARDDPPPHAGDTRSASDEEQDGP